MKLSYIVPAHNSSAVIEHTCQEIANRIEGLDAEIIVVENGSTDDTSIILERIAAGWNTPKPELVITKSEIGLGSALRHGVLRSRGDRVVLTADDLPFNFDDLTAFEAMPTPPDVIIGSKFHPDSQVDRSLSRQVLSAGLRTFRYSITRMTIRDTQGTYIVRGDWARKFAQISEIPGYLWTAELAYSAHLSGLSIVEVPVRLSASHAEHASRVKPRDIREMGIGLLELRRRKRELTIREPNSAEPTD